MLYCCSTSVQPLRPQCMHMCDLTVTLFAAILAHHDTRKSCQLLNRRVQHCRCSGSPDNALICNRDIKSLWNNFYFDSSLHMCGTEEEPEQQYRCKLRDTCHGTALLTTSKN